MKIKIKTTIGELQCVYQVMTNKRNDCLREDMFSNNFFKTIAIHDICRKLESQINKSLANDLIKITVSYNPREVYIIGIILYDIVFISIENYRSQILLNQPKDLNSLWQ